MFKELPLLYYAKREIISRMDEFKRENGSLLPERELSQMLSISRPTLRQTLEVMVHEGLLRKVPRQGYFCTDAPHHSQIGIIQTGKMIPRLEVFRGIIQVLESELCWVSVIHAPRFSMIKPICREYGLSGLIYYYPPEENLEDLVGILNEHNMPSVLVSPFSNSLESIALGSISAAMVGHEITGICVADFCAQNHYRRILKIGKASDPIDDALQQNKQNLSISSISTEENKIDFESQLVRHLDTDQPELLISGGGIWVLEAIFKILNNHQLGKTISLLLPDIPEVANLIQRYPQIRIGGLLQFPFNELGKWAAKELLRQVHGASAAGLMQFPSKIKLQ